MIFTCGSGRHEGKQRRKGGGGTDLRKGEEEMGGKENVRAFPVLHVHDAVLTGLPHTPLRIKISHRKTTAGILQAVKLTQHVANLPRIEAGTCQDVLIG